MIAFVLIALVLVPTAILFSPRNALIPVSSWSLLPIGVIMLDNRVHRTDSNGLGEAILFAWLLLVGSILLLRILVEFVRSVNRGPPAYGRLQQLWSMPPITALLVISGLHWMATNWFAGFQPAWLAHLILAAIGAAGAWLARGRREHLFIPLQPLTLGAFLTALTLLIFILLFVAQAALYVRAADREASGASYCLLTTDGGSWRPATTWLELSPLVMRDRGRHAVATGAWLVVRRADGLLGYGYQPVPGRFTAAVPLDSTELACQPGD